MEKLCNPLWRKRDLTNIFEFQVLDFSISSVMPRISGPQLDIGKFFRFNSVFLGVDCLSSYGDNGLVFAFVFPLLNRDGNEFSWINDLVVTIVAIIINRETDVEFTGLWPEPHSWHTITDLATVVSSTQVNDVCPAWCLSILFDIEWDSPFFTNFGNCWN